MGLLNFIEERVKSKDYRPDVCYCVYTKMGSNEAEGVMYFQELECKFISGRYGKGPAPMGEWKGYKILDYNLDDEPERKNMSAFGVAFQVPLATPDTGRSGIAIHPDDGADGGLLGTLGCIGLLPESPDHIIRIRNKFKHWFEMHNVLEVNIC